MARRGAEIIVVGCAASALCTGIARADATASGPVLQEVLVTATRRSEDLSQVPQSVAVFDAASLDARGIRTAEDLANLAPGVDLTQVLGIQTNIAVRGISNSAGQITTGDATTGIYIDDTPVQIRSIGNGPGDPLPDMFDVERVEVLRGPQGTLFGSGSEGGAIRFIYAQPSLHDRSGNGRAELAFTKDGGTSYEAGAAIGGPIVDGVLGFRVSAHYRQDGGDVDRVPYPNGAGPQPPEFNANYVDTSAARAALLWSPTEGLNITPSVYFRKTNTNDTSNYWLMLSDPSSQHYVSGNGESSPDTNRSDLAALKIEWAPGAFDLISNTSYYNRRETNLSDYRVLVTNTFGPITGQNPFPVFATPGYYDNGLITNTQTNWSEELRVQSTNSAARFQWLGGIFYGNRLQVNYQNIRSPFFDLETGVPNAAETFFGVPLIDGQYLYTEQITTRDKQLAGFGELNFDLTRHLRLTVGARVARTETEFSDVADGPIAGGPQSNVGKHTETPTTPKLALTYRFDSKNLMYASVSEGFRIGGVNKTVSSTLCAADLEALGFKTAPQTYNSDRVRNYEIGLKSEPTERFRIATSVYYIKWTNIIQPVDLVSCGESITLNLGQAVSKGADLDITFLPTRNLMLDLMLNYNDAKFTQTIRLPDATSNIVTDGWTLGQTPWTVNFTGEFSFQGPRDWTSYIRADAYYRSVNNGLTAVTDPESATYDPFLRPNPSTLDVRLRYGMRVSSWDVSLFVNNATNNHPVLNRQDDAVGGAIQYSYFPVRPITVGLTAQSRF
jgi:outer membrane receptor protein involved in Fe transport